MVYKILAILLIVFPSFDKVRQLNSVVRKHQMQYVKTIETHPICGDLFAPTSIRVIGEMRKKALIANRDKFIENMSHEKRYYFLDGVEIVSGNRKGRIWNDKVDIRYYFTKTDEEFKLLMSDDVLYDDIFKKFDRVFETISKEDFSSLEKMSLESQVNGGYYFILTIADCTDEKNIESYQFYQY